MPRKVILPWRTHETAESLYEAFESGRVGSGEFIPCTIPKPLAESPIDLVHVAHVVVAQLSE